MQATIRPYITTGVALVGASVIAVSPVAPPVPDLESQAHALSSAAVALRVNPIDFYTEVFERSLGNAQDLADAFLANPFPILAQVLANQFANVENLVDALGVTGELLLTALTEEVPELLQTAFDDLAAGNIEGALNTLLTLPLTVALPLLNLLDPLISPLTNALNNFNAVVQGVLGEVVLGGLIGLSGPVISGIGSIGTAIQGVVDAAGSGDIGEIFDALVNIPAVIADGVLNGGYGPLLLGFLPAPGLLSPDLGPIGIVLAIRESIANFLTPTTMLAKSGAVEDVEADEGLRSANSLPDDSANVVNISTYSSLAEDMGESAGEGASAGEGDDGSGEGGGGVVGGDNGAGGEEQQKQEEENQQEENEEEGGDDTGFGDERGDGNTANGGTDLSGGNKAEPGQTGGNEANTGGGDNGQVTQAEENTNEGGDGGDDGDNGSGGGDGGEGGSE
ncbi:hypothetical protein [Mycolicibacterium phlei]